MTIFKTILNVEDQNSESIIIQLGSKKSYNPAGSDSKNTDPEQQLNRTTQSARGKIFQNRTAWNGGAARLTSLTITRENLLQYKSCFTEAKKLVSSV